MKFYLTDSNMCRLLRPIPKIKDKPLHFNCSVRDPNYNSLYVKNGKWTAKLHQVFDFVCDERPQKIIPKYRMLKYCEEIEKFNFVGSIYGQIVTGPLLNVIDGEIKLNINISSQRSIPESLYSVSPSAQFLYRHFFAPVVCGRTFEFRYDVISRYLNNRRHTPHIQSFIEELIDIKLLKNAHFCTKMAFKIVKSL